MKGQPLWQNYLPEAWAAIMAMITAATLETGRIGKADAGRVYRTMIDAAMLE